MTTACSAIEGVGFSGLACCSFARSDPSAFALPWPCPRPCFAVIGTDHARTHTTEMTANHCFLIHPSPTRHRVRSTPNLGPGRTSLSLTSKAQQQSLHHAQNQMRMRRDRRAVGGRVTV